MNYWIFQSKPEHYNMSRTSSLKPGARDDWWATRYRTEMRPGDLVYFWQAGSPDQRGVHGWGRIVSEPYTRGDRHKVDVVYEGKLPQPVPAATISDSKDLRNLMILRLAVGTNFLINKKEARALAELMPHDHRPEVG